MLPSYDVIVVGAGHAGCEAAAAAANLGSKVLLITMDLSRVAAMSCNPAMGGIAKGQIVREIDALGGYSGIVTDSSMIQFKMLNMSKGPAMWSPRAQCDRNIFISQWKSILESIPNIDFWQDSVTSLIFENNTVVGVRTSLHLEIYAKAIVLTNGTFLNGNMHFGMLQIPGGRISESPSYFLSDQLKDFGFRVGRMKTGTPVRIDGRTIDFSKTIPQPGDDMVRSFSFLPDTIKHSHQLDCFLIYTNETVHEILKSHFDESPLYNGTIQSTGPRYCPSIETKIVTFSEKTSHQLFLEPETFTSCEYYLNGFSSSLPPAVQYEALKHIPALKNCKIFKPGYAIEYDYFDPTQLHNTLESKICSNLFMAGQINGTTGYEEAAGQGIIAGINAHLKINQKDPFTLRRDEAYIGVLIDDLVSKGVNEPYRMFTSRSEFRTLLRQDNADVRLTPKSFQIGLASEQRFRACEHKYNLINETVSYLSTNTIKPSDINEYLGSINSSPISQNTHIHQILCRPEATIVGLRALSLEKLSLLLPLSYDMLESVEISIKYAGYISKERSIANKISKLEYLTLPHTIDYTSMSSLSTEAKQKLSHVRPDTVGQAARISGVSPSDISIILLYLGR
jgi:tRNA uridine 5-carboxymethylaminomethyl modification enzyme